MMKSLLPSLVFLVKNASFMRIINLKIVAAEIMRTLVGSVGLVMVAPITALVGGVIFAGVLKSPRPSGF